MAPTGEMSSANPILAQMNLPPRIVANRSQLDDRFPVLGFTIFSDRPGLYEVLLASDRNLLCPMKPGQATVAGYYSSRSDSGLVPIVLGTAVYLAPAAVLHAFARQNPRPDEIYYTVVMYPDASGSQAVFAQPPESLAASAPSIALSPHFGSDGLDDVLGMRAANLRRVQPAPVAQNSVAPMAALSREEDRSEGEDGSSDPILPAIQTRATRGEAPYDDGDGVPRHEAAHGSPAPAAYSSGSGYDDGYGVAPPPNAELSFASSQQNSFRPSDPEPAVLEDEGMEDDRYGQYTAAPAPATASLGAAGVLPDPDDDDFSEGPYRLLAAEGYGDEADEWAGEAPAYQPLELAAAGLATEAGPLTIEAKRDLIGKLGEYSAVAADPEFNGVFGPDHPAYGRYHLGVSVGVAPFVQESGSLGRLLQLEAERDPAKFAGIFGENANALLQVTGAQGPSSSTGADGRSPRLQPVGGADLWQEPWLSRFREAGCHKPFQSAQNQLAASLFLDPMTPFAAWLGLDTERGLAILVDRAAQLGVGPAQEWVINAVGPLQTPPQRHQALAALGFDNIRAFQSAHPGVETNGQWGALSHAAAVAALRGRGNSPVPIPAAAQMLDALVRRSTQTPWFARIRALRHDSRLGDVPFHRQEQG